MRERRISIFLLTAMALALCCVFHAAGAETWYVENEWNYLDTSMDISGGIPGIDIVTCGPHCEEYHTPKEWLDLASFRTIYEVLKRTLEIL